MREATWFDCGHATNGLTALSFSDPHDHPHPQRTQDDCAICTVAMVMGPPYSYEQVLADSVKYPRITSDGKFFAWWETYFRDERFDSIYSTLAAFARSDSRAAPSRECWAWIFRI